MNRRAFLRGLGLAPVAAAVAPSLVAQAETSQGYRFGGWVTSYIRKDRLIPDGGEIGPEIVGRLRKGVGDAGPQIVKFGQGVANMDAYPDRYIGSGAIDDPLMQRMAARFD